ncbi:MAG: hypothetical protein IPJ65_00570 [Archangiaceae bacterium]|nr:hypothetical protein [Archangiaceae bacterium]
MGIVAYEMLTGDVPFNSESAVETLMMQLEVVPKLPGEIEPTIPEQLEQLVMRMLEKLPEDRPASAAEVKREIARIKRQLTNAETQISQTSSIAETLIPPDPAERGSAETSREQLPVGARRLETDVSGTIDPAEVMARSETSRLKLQRPRPPWVVPALAGAAAVLVLALVAYALSKRATL